VQILSGSQSQIASDLPVLVAVQSGFARSDYQVLVFTSTQLAKALMRDQRVATMQVVWGSEQSSIFEGVQRAWIQYSSASGQ
jgi:hypothetical protein